VILTVAAATKIVKKSLSVADINNGLHVLSLHVKLSIKLSNINYRNGKEFN
jgi:hypothetical protein